MITSRCFALRHPFFIFFALKKSCNKAGVPFLAQGLESKLVSKGLFHNPLASWPAARQVGLIRLAVLEAAQVCPLDALASDSWKPLAA